MSRCGVLLCLILLLNVAAARAGGLIGTVAGVADQTGLQQQLFLQYSGKKDDFALVLNSNVSLAALPLSLAWEPAWRLAYKQLAFSRNQPHFTSPDFFRLVHKNHFKAKTTVFWADTPNISAAWFGSIPFKNEDLVNGLYLQGFLKLRQLGLGAAFLQAGAGNFTVLEARLAEGPFKISAAAGLREKSPAAVLELAYQKGKYEANLAWQHVAADFVSPFAQTNKYTPNRRGWHLKSSFPLGDVLVSLNRRRQGNLAQTTQYNQYSWKFAAAGYNTEVEWRLEPTKAFLIRYKGKGAQLEIDPLRQSGRFDSTLFARLNYRISFDAPRRIGRLELRFNLGLKWRLIAKRDFLKNRLNYSALAEFENKNFRFSLAVGVYDRGNIHAGFDAPRQASISWEWDF